MYVGLDGYYKGDLRKLKKLLVASSNFGIYFSSSKFDGLMTT